VNWVVPVTEAMTKNPLNVASVELVTKTIPPTAAPFAAARYE